MKVVAGHKLFLAHIAPPFFAQLTFTARQNGRDDHVFADPFTRAGNNSPADLVSERERKFFLRLHPIMPETEVGMAYATSRYPDEDFMRSGYFSLVGVEEGTDEVDRWLVSGEAQIALIIGSGYAEAVHAGRVPHVQVIADGSDASGTTVALG